MNGAGFLAYRVFPDDLPAGAGDPLQAFPVFKRFPNVPGIKLHTFAHRHLDNAREIRDALNDSAAPPRRCAMLNKFEGSLRPDAVGIFKVSLTLGAKS